MGTVNQDVHAWTPAVRQRFIETREPRHLQPCVTIDYLCDIVKQRAPHSPPVLAKMRARTANGMYADPDLGGANVWQLLVDVAVRACERDAWPEVDETFKEMAHHCTQGDSHRLYFLWWALTGR